MALNRLISWEKIRSLGELQILTKASYIALILVPIMAGLWPSVRVAINHYNKAAKEASYILEVAQTNLNTEIENIRMVSSEIKELSAPLSKNISDFATNFETITEQLNTQVNSFMNEFNPEELDTPRLPTVWVFAFFGSLLVVIGHTIYQASAPDIIKNYTKMALMDKAREDAIKAGYTKRVDIVDATTKAKERYEYVSTSGLLIVKVYAGMFYLFGLSCIIMVVLCQIEAVLAASGGINI